MQHHKKESWENPKDNNTKGKDLGGSKQNPYYQSNKDGREHGRDERNRSETRRLRQDQDQVLSVWETTQEARIQETSIRVRYGKLKDNLNGREGYARSEKCIKPYCPKNGAGLAQLLDQPCPSFEVHCPSFGTGLIEYHKKMIRYDYESFSSKTLHPPPKPITNNHDK